MTNEQKKQMYNIENVTVKDIEESDAVTLAAMMRRVQLDTAAFWYGLGLIRTHAHPVCFRYVMRDSGARQAGQ